MAALTGPQVRRMRARAQGLHGGSLSGEGLSGEGGDGGEGIGGAAGGGPGRTVADAVRLSAGLQAQDVKACRLQVRARTHGLVAADVDAACARREVVRTWLMRGTLHAVAARDVRWMTALLGPRAAGAHRGRRERLGLDEELCTRGLAALERVLAGRRLTRDALVGRLAREGVVLDPRSQAPAHLLLYAAARGLVCRGPEAAGDTATYTLTEEWLEGVPDAGLTGDEALAELAVRHAAAYGPVSAADFARWAGLPLGRARRGQAAAGGRLAAVAGPEGPLTVTAGCDAAAPAGAAVRMTGHFDPYLLGYHDRDLLLPPEVAPRVATGGGMLMPCVVRDGLVVAGWRHGWRAGALAVRVEPFTERRTSALAAAITSEVADIGRFLGVPAAWEWAGAG